MLRATRSNSFCGVSVTWPRSSLARYRFLRTRRALGESRGAWRAEPFRTGSPVTAVWALSFMRNPPWCGRTVFIEAIRSNHDLESDASYAHHDVPVKRKAQDTGPCKS